MWKVRTSKSFKEEDIDQRRHEMWKGDPSWLAEHINYSRKVSLIKQIMVLNYNKIPQGTDTSGKKGTPLKNTRNRSSFDKVSHFIKLNCYTLS